MRHPAERREREAQSSHHIWSFLRTQQCTGLFHRERCSTWLQRCKYISLKYKIKRRGKKNKRTAKSPKEIRKWGRLLKKEGKERKTIEWDVCKVIIGAWQILIWDNTRDATGGCFCSSEKVCLETPSPTYFCFICCDTAMIDETEICVIGAFTNSLAGGSLQNNGHTIPSHHKRLRSAFLMCHMLCSSESCEK